LRSLGTRGLWDALAVAFDLHFQDDGVVHQAVRGGQRCGRLGKDIYPPWATNEVSSYPTMSQAKSPSRTNSVSTQSRMP
jgi:hypothetical protein